MHLSQCQTTDLSIQELDDMDKLPLLASNVTQLTSTVLLLKIKQLNKSLYQINRKDIQTIAKSIKIQIRSTFQEGSRGEEQTLDNMIKLIQEFRNTYEYQSEDNFWIQFHQGIGSAVREVQLELQQTRKIIKEQQQMVIIKDHPSGDSRQIQWTSLQTLPYSEPVKRHQILSQQQYRQHSQSNIFISNLHQNESYAFPQVRHKQNLGPIVERNIPQHLGLGLSIEDLAHRTVISGDTIPASTIDSILKQSKDQNEIVQAQEQDHQQVLAPRNPVYQPFNKSEFLILQQNVKGRMMINQQNLFIL